MLIESHVNSQGRVVIPAEVRRHLGISGETSVQFLMCPGSDEVRLVTPELMRMTLWANNQGGDGGDSAVDVRNMRDQEAALLAEDAPDDVADDERSDSELFADLSAALGL